MGLKGWFKRRFGKDVEVKPNNDAVTAYVLAGGEFGDVVSMIWMGECVGFEDLLTRFEVTERAYADCGYRTISIDDFTGYGGWGQDIEPLLRVPRKVNERPIYHAKYYRENFLHRNMVTKAHRVGENGAFSATYVRPSTEHLKDE